MKTNKNIRVVIQLDYDLDAFTDQENDPTTVEEFIENYLENYVYEDLTDLMRGDRLHSWSEITVMDI